MRLEADPDALAFGASVAALFADVADPAALRLAWDTADGRIPGLWPALAEIGVLGALVPESHGGLGLDARSLLPVLVESGRAAIPEPLVETLVGSALLAEAGGSAAERWLLAIADGKAAIAVGIGPGMLVSAAPWADALILTDRTGAAHVVPVGEVTLHEEQSIDRGIRLARVDWQPTDATRLEDVDPEAAFDLASVAVAAQLTGLADTMLDLSVRYALQREQFGTVIGAFQAVKHQLADTYVSNAFAKPVVARGAWSVAAHEPTRWRDASHAKFAASRAALGAARTALQVHAGIGYTFEHDLHMWMKRTWSLTSLWGDVAWHRNRVADAVLDNS
jgi:alkylation response protein AidB-like acyl-CoA dehydrogenase